MRARSAAEAHVDPSCFIADVQDLKDQFREVGVVVYANVVKDDTGRSKGWGIVEFETPEEVSALMAALSNIGFRRRRMRSRKPVLL